MADIKGKKVIIVEDDNFFISLVSKKLNAGGLMALSASDGKSGVELIKKEMPAVVILDIMLPDMDGFEILKKIKEDPVTRPIPVVFLSNLGSREDVQKGKELGAYSFLIKATVTMDEVLQEVSKIILAS
ncbi:MAG: response regulator [bacterium]